MRIGIPLEEKILEKYTLSEYIKKLKRLSIDYVEVALDFDEYSIKFYADLLNIFVQHGINIHYHLPHFYNKALDLSYFSMDNSILTLFLFQLKKVHPLNHSSTLVIHGAKYEIQEKRIAYQKTQMGLNYLLNFFKDNNLSIRLALETLNAKKHKVIGNSREDILSILDTIDSDRLGICWDITHDFLTQESFNLPTEKFLNKITHLHIHGVDDQDHLSLNQSKIDFKEHLRLIKSQLNHIPMTIELLGSTHFFQDITSSIQYLDTINRRT